MLGKKEDVNIVEVDAEKSPEIASKYNVNEFPALIFVKKEEVVDTHVGLIGKADFEDLLDKHL